MKFTNFIDKNDLENNFLKSLEKVEENLEKINLAISNDLNYLTKNSYQLVASLLVGDNRIEKIIFNELITTCFQLELKCQGTSYFFIKAFIEFAKEYIKKENKTYNNLIKENKENSVLYLNNILKKCQPASEKEINEIIDNICNDEIAATIIKEATKLAGIEGNIVLEENELENIIVELQFGYNFKISGFKGFMPSLGTWERNEVKVLLIDGLVEKVSELDKILSKTFETKKPLMILAQGFSEEVIATLYTNNSRKNFDVMPVRLEQSLETLNVLNDIAVVCGGDVVNSLKGDILALVDYDLLPEVEKISITNNVLSIQNSSSRASVISHLNYLKDRRKDQEKNTSITDLSDLTTKRIQNLLSHIVKVGIPKDLSKKIKVKIDNSLRICRSVYTYGLCAPKEISTENLSITWKKAHEKMLDKNFDDKIPSLCYYFAASFAANLAASYFTSSGGIILED